MSDPEDRWTFRFHRDQKAWVRDPKVFVDMGRAMSDGSPALLKTRQHIRREQAEGMWRTCCVRGGSRFLLLGDLMQNPQIVPS